VKKVDTATIFVLPRRELAGLPCFDVRFDTQELPGGVYVVGCGYEFGLRSEYDLPHECPHCGEKISWKGIKEGE